MDISVKADIAALEKQLGGIAKEHRSKAIVPALNRTGKTAQNKTGSAAAKKISVKAAVARERVTFAGKASADQLRVTLRIDDQKLKFLHFSPRRLNNGQVSVRIFGKRHKYGSPLFLVPQGSRRASGQVMLRTSKKRLPLRIAYGPSIADGWEKDQPQQILRSTVQERLPVEYGRALRGLIRRYG